MRRYLVIDDRSFYRRGEARAARTKGYVRRNTPAKAAEREGGDVLAFDPRVLIKNTTIETER